MPKSLPLLSALEFAALQLLADLAMEAMVAAKKNKSPGRQELFRNVLDVRIWAFDRQAELASEEVA